MQSINQKVGLTFAGCCCLRALAAEAIVGVSIAEESAATKAVTKCVYRGIIRKIISHTHTQTRN